jgi:hypothetical protein
MKRLMLSPGVSLIACFPGYSAPLHKTFSNHSARFFQQAIISGKVIDNKGQPLADVTVTVKSTGQCTMIKIIEPAVPTGRWMNSVIHMARRKSGVCCRTSVFCYLLVVP